jgi:hypothetical protein
LVDSFILAGIKLTNETIAHKNDDMVEEREIAKPSRGSNGKGSIRLSVPEHKDDIYHHWLFFPEHFMELGVGVRISSRALRISVIH